LFRLCIRLGEILDQCEYLLLKQVIKYTVGCEDQ
jgi:hypothetical protein